MHYLSLVPSLIATLILCVCDLCTRTVPRFVVIAGVLFQLVAFAVFPLPSFSGELWKKVATAFVLALCCGLVQLLLCLIAPHAIGLGDATASVLLGFGIAFYHDVIGLCAWWFFIGILGMGTLFAVQIWHSIAGKRTRLNKNGDKSTSIAFVPVLATAALVTYSVGLWLW